MFNIGLVSMSVAASVCVLSFHFRDHRKTKVPKFLKMLLLMKESYKYQYQKDILIYELPNQTIEHHLHHHRLAHNKALNETHYVNLNDEKDEDISTNNFIEDFRESEIRILKENYKKAKANCDNIEYFDTTNSIPIKIQKGHKEIRKLNTQQNNILMSSIKSNTINPETIIKNKNLEKVLALIKKSLKILEMNHIRTKENTLIYDEWKEVDNF